jgi:hypothetical protein
LTWLALAIFSGWLLGWVGVALALIIIPACGWLAVRFAEELDGFIGGARALRFYFTRRWFFKELLAERRRLREEIASLGAELPHGVARLPDDNDGETIHDSPARVVPTEPTRHTI